jgi:hypothetical protein
MSPGEAQHYGLCWPQSPVRGSHSANGLENTGPALANADTLWINPIDHQEPLAEAVELLATAAIAVSVYSLPRYVPARSTWPVPSGDQRCALTLSNQQFFRCSLIAASGLELLCN